MVAVVGIAVGYVALTQDSEPSAASSTSSSTTIASSTTTTVPPSTVVPAYSDAEIGAEYGDAVFKIETTGCGYTGTGSGFAIDDHHIVTNRHVVDIDATPSINTRTGARFTGRVIGWEEQPDIAVIEVDRNLTKWIDWTSADTLIEGQNLVSLGYPLPDHDFTVTPGVILSFVTQGYHRVAIRSDAQLDRGNSGGPSLVADGRVAGVVTQMDLNQDGFQFVPIIMTTDEVLETVESILRHPSTPTVDCDSIDSGVPPYSPGVPTVPDLPEYDHPVPPFYTVILASMATSNANRQDAVERANELSWQYGLETGVLYSNDFNSLTPGYWVVYTGVFYDRDPAIALAADMVRYGIDAYAKQVTW